jgi:hypothetical protein
VEVEDGDDVFSSSWSEAVVIDFVLARGGGSWAVLGRSGIYAGLLLDLTSTRDLFKKKIYKRRAWLSILLKKRKKDSSVALLLHCETLHDQRVESHKLQLTRAYVVPKFRPVAGLPDESKA